MKFQAIEIISKLKIQAITEKAPPSSSHHSISLSNHFADFLIFISIKACLAYILIGKTQLNRLELVTIMFRVNFISRTIIGSLTTEHRAAN